jgi:AcrR family transcriptional regulator
MKNKILIAAAQEMNHRGLKFTIDHVATKVGISKKTIYQYYASKDILITEVINMALADVEEQETVILVEKDKDFAERIKKLMLLEPKSFGKTNDWVMEDIKRFRPLDWQKIEQFKYERMLVLSDFLEEGIVQGLVPKMNTKVAARLLLGACREISQYEFLVENNLDFTQARQLLTDIFLYGILKGSIVSNHK